MASLASGESEASVGAGGDEVVRRKPVRERAMSSITKLLIQGIRGFGASDEQKAVIEFGKPLTLITGQNGAGKTTVIECLKYATTGELPPNTKGNGAFVHDPKLVNERSVRGIVKLKFQNVSGDNVVCHRILQSTQKPRKLEQKAMDSSLSKILPGGEKSKITTRCADINREMIDQLGVSKAILTHVIFCHQEESSWPLSEGKALKAKFDDIFASTRYTKALDNFKKIQQDLTSEIRIYKTELHHLSKQKEKVDEVKANLQDAQKKVDNSKADITRVNNELVPLEGRLQDLTNKYDEVAKIEKDITMHESSRKELLRSQQQLESRLERVFPGSKAELREEREQHSGIVERNHTDLEECARNLDKLVKSMDGIKRKMDEQHVQHGRLKTEEQYHKDRVASRDKSLVAAAKDLLPGYAAGPFSQSKVDEFLQDFSQHRAETKRNFEAEKARLVSKERGVQEKLDQLRTNLAKIEESVQLKRSTIRECRAKVTSISHELTAIGSGAAALEGVDQELAGAEKELLDYHESVDLTAMEEELDTLSLEKQRLGTKLAQLQKEQAQLGLYSSARGAIDGLKKQKKEKEDSYQMELGAVEPELLSLLGVMPSLEQNLSDCVRGLTRSKEQEKQAASDQHRNAVAKLSRFQAQKEELEKQLKEREARVDSLQKEVREVCGEETADSYQEMVASLQQKIDSASENISTVKGSQSFFRKSLEKLHSSHKCPLCMRGFEEKSALDSTIKLITTRLNEAIPRMIPRLNSELQNLQEQQKKLQELKPKIDEVSRIRTQELPHRRTALEEKGKGLAEVQASVDKQLQTQAQLQGELDHLRVLEPKVTKVTQLKEQLKELENKIVSEEAKLGHLRSGSQRSQHLVSRELTTTQRNMEEFNRKMDNKRQEITESQRTERQLEGRVHGLKEERLHLQSQQQKRETLVSKKKDLTVQIGSLENDVKLESNRVEPVREKMEGLEGERAESSRERGELESKSWAELEHLRVTYESLRKTSDTINRYFRDGKDKALEECEGKVQVLTEQVKAKNSAKKELEEKINVLTKELANAKNKERELADNLQLITQKEEIEQKERRVRQLRETLQSMGLDRYEDEYQRLQADVERLRKEHARAEGHKLGQEDQVRHLQRELQSDLYSNTETRYMDMVIKQKTTETASKDLGKYYKALDRAITRFHGQKMKEINQIIRELWIKTYKGGDIDRIEVRSDDGAQSDGTTIATRRVYNYRVAMLKGSTELDMRGRCSAGQKVMASIIIRLALAETFCLTSGLLALDEPTTNLDRDNVEGLAHALTDIIKARSENQKNFQLIIITHDEAFVELLGHAGYTDCFYRVTKSFGETSKIGRYYF